MELIDKLKSEGYEVKIRHERTTPGTAELALKTGTRVSGLSSTLLKPKHQLKDDGVPIAPRVGRTIAIISLNDEEVARGEAVCSPADNFDKKLGTIKALGRAVGELRRGEDS